MSSAEQHSLARLALSAACLHLSRHVLAFSLGTALLPIAFSQTPPATTNADGLSAYSALRNLTLGGEAYSVADFDLKRDAGTLRIRSGTFCFTPAVNGQVTGAVFVGDGVFLLTPPNDTERKSLKFLTKEDEFNEKFERLALRFTDSTHDDIKKVGTASTASCDAGILRDSQNTTRHKTRSNLEIQLLGEVLSPHPRPIFIAFIHGKRYNDKEIFEIDPNLNSSQVNFWTYDDNKWGYWASFSLSGNHPPGTIGKPIGIAHQQLETTLEKSGNLSGKATATLISLREGLRVVPLALFRSLRVESVTADGQGLAFNQK